MIAALDHVGLRVGDLDEASARWCAQFGLHEVGRADGRVRLACDDEPCAIELVGADGREPGHDHTAWRLRAGVSLEDAAARLEAADVVACRDGDAVWCEDPEGQRVQLVPARTGPTALTSFARAPSGAPLGHPRRLGHVNFLTGRLDEQLAFHVDVLGFALTDHLGEDAAWLRVGGVHHELAFVRPRAGQEPRLHHLALDVVDTGQMRMAMDHLGRHGRWLSWGPTRHGVGGNIAAYVRITEEPLHVELYCDMELIEADHTPRVWPDDRFSSNTWGPLPPRSYFRFDDAAIASERDSLETRGVLLPDPPETTS